MVLLHGFVKATKKTRKADIDIALERKAIKGEGTMKKHDGSTLDSLFRGAR
jgi:phage-related protein